MAVPKCFVQLPIRHLLVCLYIVGLSLAAVAPCRANDYFWTNKSNNSTWDATTLNWTPGLGFAPWSNGSGAIFTASGAGSIAIDAGGVSVGSILFLTDGYTLSGPGTLTLVNGSGSLGSATIGFNTGASATISSIIDGSAGLTLTGNGTLTLPGTNIYSGGTTIKGGVLAVSADGNLGAVPGAAAPNVIINGGVLRALQSFTLDANRRVVLGAATGAGTGTIDVASGKTLSIAGTIQNGTASTGSLVKIGAGTLLLLNGSNSWSGSTQINDGILRSGAAGSLPNGANITIGNVAGALLDLNNFDALLVALNGGGAAGGNVNLGSATLRVGNGTFAGSIGGSGSLVKTAGGSLTLTAVNSYTGTTSVYAGSLTVTNDAGLGTAPAAPLANSITLDGGKLAITSGTVLHANRGILLGGAGGTLELPNGQTVNYAGMLSGTGSWTAQGAGTLVLGSVQTWNGPLYLSGAATLQLTAANMFPSGISIQYSSGGGPNATLDLNGFDQTIGSTNSSLNIKLGGATLTFGNAESNWIHSGVISGSGNLIKVGSGSFQLNGTNTFNGTTTVKSGTLTINADAALGTAPAAATPGSITLDGGKLTFAGTLNANRGITIGAGGGSLNASGGTATYNGIITGGNLTINSSGSSTLILGGVNSLTGSVTVSNGTLKLGASNVLPANVSLTLSGGGLDLNGFGLTVGAISTASANSIALGGATLTVNDSGSDRMLGIITSASGGSLVKTGAGTLQLSSASSTYLGPTSITGGTLLISADGALGTAPAGATPNQLVLDGGILSINSGITLNANRGIAIGLNGGSISTVSTVTYAGVIANPAGTPAFSVLSGPLTLTGTSSFTGSVVVGPGATLNLQGGAGSLTAASSFAVQIGALLSLGTTSGGAAGVNHDRIGDTAGITLDGATFSWVSAASSTVANETVGTLTLGSGTNAVTFNPGGTVASSGVHGITFGSAAGVSLARNPGATLEFTLTNASKGSIRFLGSTPTNSGAAPILLGGYAIVGGSDWAVIDGVTRAISALSSYQTSTNSTTWLTTDNVKVSSNVSVATTRTINSLNFTGGSTLNLTGGGLNISSGGILDSSSSSVTISAGTLTSGYPTGELFLNDTGALLSISSQITAGNIVKSGGSTVSLTNASVANNNQVSGSTYINEGALGIVLDANLGSTAAPLIIMGDGPGLTGGSLLINASIDLSSSGVPRNIALNRGGAISVASGFTATAPGVISGTGTFTKSGQGTLVLSANETYTGNTIVGLGTLKLGVSNALPTATELSLSGTFDLNGFDQTLAAVYNAGSILLSNGSTLNVSRSYVIFSGFSGTISGNGVLVVQGSAATINLTQANSSFSGKVKAAGGGGITLFDDPALGTISGSDAITLDNGSISFGTGTTYTLAATRGITLGPGGGTIGAGGFALPQPTVTYNGTIAGPGKLSVTGGGTLVLGGTNTYQGGTSVNSVTVSVSADANLGTAPATPTNNIWLELSGILSASASFTLDSNRTIVLRGGSLAAAVGQTFSIGGRLINDPGGSSPLNISGSGVVLISNTQNDFSSVSIGGGTLRLGAANVLPRMSDVSISLGTTLDLNGFDQTVRSVTVAAFGSGTPAIQLGTGNLTVGTSLQSSSFSGVISGSGKVIVQGVSLTLTGANQQTGGIVVNDGTLQINSDANLGPAGGANVLTMNGSTLTINNTSHQVLDANRSIVLGPGGGKLNILVSTQSVEIASVISGVGGLTVVDQGISGHQINLSGMNTYQGPTQIGGNMTLLVSHALPDGTDVTFSDSSTTAIHFEIGGTTQIFGSLATIGSNQPGAIIEIFTGPAQLFIGNSLSTTYNGRISGGGPSTTITKQGTGTLTLSQDLVNFSSHWHFNGGAVAIGLDTNLGLPLDGNKPVVDNLIFNGGALQAYTTLSVRRYFGTTLNDAGGTLAANANVTMTYAPIIAGVGGLTIAGPGTVTLTGVSTYQGPTTVASGTLKLGIANALPSTTALVLLDGSAPIVNLVTGNQTIGSLAGGAGGQVILGNSLIVGGADSTVFAGKLNSTGGLTRQGTGSLTLTGANDYTGATGISSGALYVNGSLSLSSAVTVNGGLLAGTGSVGAVTVNVSGSISAGGPVAAGMLTASSVNLAGGNYRWKVEGPSATGVAGTDWDLLHVTSLLTLGSGAKVQISDPTFMAWNPAQSQQWAIATFGSLSGNPSAVAIDVSAFSLPIAANSSFFLTSDATTLYMNYGPTPTPEPRHVLGIIVLAISFVAVIQRRRRPSVG